MRKSIVVALSAALLFLGACGSGEAPPEAPPPAARPIGQVVEITPPLGLPPVPVPADNPPTAETIALGRRLYYETKLSKDGTLSCATCHHPDHGFADGKQFSAGMGGALGGRNAPTVYNAAYYAQQFWDGRAASLELQAAGPVQNPVEMAETLENVEQKLASDPTYLADFEKAFGPGPVTYDKAGKAIAAFERTIISANSPFDRYMYGGDQTALSESAKRGLEVFRDAKKGNCAVCHTIEEKHALFTDNKYHNLGVGVDTKRELADLGRFKETNVDADRGAFKTPSLRNIALTAPYMHDGSLNTLKDVIDFYIGGGNSNEWRDKEIHELGFLSGQERQDLQAFLESLTGEIPANAGPPTD